MADSEERPDTREAILRIARDLVRAGGPRALTFEAVARRLGKSKQAVLYWFPTKDRLLTETLLPDLAAEAGAARAALQGRFGAGAVRAFVEAVAGFHLENLDRFRLVYLAPRSGAPTAGSASGRHDGSGMSETTRAVHTDLAACLDGPAARARQEAAAIHAAVLGLILTISQAEGRGEALPAEPDDLVDALARRLAGEGA